MFTGYYRNQSERIENVIVNGSLSLSGVLLVLKLVDVGSLSWYMVAAPLTLPIGVFMTIIIGGILLLGVSKFLRALEKQITGAMKSVRDMFR